MVKKIALVCNQWIDDNMARGKQVDRVYEDLDIFEFLKEITAGIEKFLERYL